jgi:hypothetical protein
VNGSLIRRPVFLALASLVVGLTLVSNPLTLPTVAQEEDQPEQSQQTPDRSPTYTGRDNVPVPPPVGEPVLEDDLVGPGVLPAGRCPTGRAVNEFTGEGFMLKVAGRCRDDSKVASIVTPLIRDLNFPDGEVRLEARAVSGQDRAALILGLRVQREGGPRGYELGVVPAQGIVSLVRFDHGEITRLAWRDDLASFLDRDGWNGVAVRARGADFWVLVNDQPVVAATDEGDDNGAIYVGLLRTGDPDDESETAMIVRNLKVSRLAD